MTKMQASVPPPKSVTTGAKGPNGRGATSVKGNTQSTASKPTSQHKIK